ncbi:MAG: YHS domain-containing protein [Deltaproteobacteria bacterium]|nr:YHS domain-containing protein [Deltaproteobacteria bacterium]
MGENDLILDLVCGMQMLTDKAKATYTYNERVFYFCGMGCLDRFKNDPEKYIKREKEGRIKWEET